MSGRYVYCVVPAGVRPDPGLAGIDDAPVHAREQENVAVWFSHCAARPAATLERLRRHQDVVATPLGAGVTPIPFRFGQWLADDDALAARIAAQAGAWRARLARLEGTCELGVRVRWPRPAAAARDVQQPQQSGRAYLEAVARQHARMTARRTDAEQLAADLRSAVAGLVIEERVDVAAGDSLAVAHLARTGDAAAWRAAVDAVCRAHGDLDFVVSGPWPPYSFAG